MPLRNVSAAVEELKRTRDMGAVAAHAVTFTLPLLFGFYGVLAGGVLDRFPKLKISFLEAGADWLPYRLQRMDHYFHSEKAIDRPGLPQRAPSEYLKDCEIYFTSEGDEKLLPEVLKGIGDDKMMILGGMPHAEARDNSITEIEEHSDISETQKKKFWETVRNG